MKKLIITVTLVFSFLNCFAQDLFGKWYLINRSGLIEYSITKDSIKSQKLFPDFSSKNEQGETFAIQKKVNLEDRILLVIKSKKDSSKYSAKILMNVIENKRCQLAWNVPDTMMIDIESLIRFNQTDKRQLFGYNLFSEYYMDSLNKMKSIDSISLTDFKYFLSVYLDKLNHTREDDKRYNTGYLSDWSYNYQMVTQSLFVCGFNPNQTSEKVELLFRKYSEDPEVKKLFPGTKKTK